MLLKHHFKRKTRAISWDERWYIALFFRCLFNFFARVVLGCAKVTDVKFRPVLRLSQLPRGFFLSSTCRSPVTSLSHRPTKFLILNSVFFCAAALWRAIFNFSVWYFYCLLIWFHYRWSVFMKNERKNNTSRHERKVRKAKTASNFLLLLVLLHSSKVFSAYNESIGGWLINLLCGEQTTKSSL